MAGAIEALTKIAAVKRAAKAAATWFWMLVLVMLMFLFGLICCFANCLAKIPTTLHRPCQFLKTYIYQMDRDISPVAEHEQKLNNGIMCQYLALSFIAGKRRVVNIAMLGSSHVRTPPQSSLRQSQQRALVVGHGAGDGLLRRSRPLLPTRSPNMASTA